MTAAFRTAPGLGWSARARDVAVAVAVGVVQVGVTLLARHGQPDARQLDVLGVALIVITAAALVVRRRRPAATLVVVFAATMAYVVADYPKGPVFLALVIALVTAVLRGHRALAWAVLGVGYVLAGWVAPIVADGGPWPDWTVAGALAAWLLVLGVGSELARVWLDRAAERAQARAEEARRRASDERLRIARELHDVLAHDISLINVRAGVALHLVDEAPDRIDPGQVRPALAAIKDASKEALGELRSVLDVLRRGEDGAAPLAPTAGLTGLDGLVERTRGTGLDVRVEWQDGAGLAAPPDEVTQGLPAGVDLAAFRVAQEALTNVVRHAGATRATVRVRRRPDALEIRVDDDGPGDGEHAPAGAPADDRRGAARGGEEAGGTGDAGGSGVPGVSGQGGRDRDEGRGIAGMRERALALGGTLEAGPRPGRGFRVRATLPLREVQ
ncbi:MAG TPA: histidine kinase [Acidimicrobiales bacterium]